MQKYLIGNLKMNFTLNEMQTYFAEFLMQKKKNDRVKVGFAIPHTQLYALKDIMKSSGVLLGSQNVFYEEKGAFTGEISARMLKESGVDFSLVGHSERRNLFKETNQDVNKKIKKLLELGIMAVLCIGESKQERACNRTNSVVKKQLEECLAGLYENEMKSVIIAYEPVWAIGTGTTPTVKQIETATAIIRETISGYFSTKMAEDQIVIYGGSIDAGNAKSFLSAKGINGGLVGTSAKIPELFANIVSITNGIK